MIVQYATLLKSSRVAFAFGCASLRQSRPRELITKDATVLPWHRPDFKSAFSCFGAMLAYMSLAVLLLKLMIRKAAQTHTSQTCCSSLSS